MMTPVLGILHPGEMGSSLISAALNTVSQVYWCSEARSEQSRLRAEAITGLREIATLQQFCSTCDIIISVCPPHAAMAQAKAVLENGFNGIYVDANAISPAQVKEIGQLLENADISFVDGGIIGLPTQVKGTTWLYLAGHDAAAVAACFDQGPFETGVLGKTIGQASALKMCFAAWNKGKTALLSSVLATAEQLGVRAALQQQWDTYDPGFSEQSVTRIRQVARKAWRFGAEMDEIASTMKACGAPQQFFEGAAEVYRRQSQLQNSDTPPDIDTILQLITRLDESGDA